LGIALFSQQLWGPLSEMTFTVSSSLFGVFYPEVVSEPDQFVLRTGSFVVRIAAACARYDGIGLMIVFPRLYRAPPLSFFRHDFRFPQALLLFPIGIAVIWCFDALRIVALIAIGHEISPDIALGGFHSQAGWLAFVLVAAGSLVMAYRVSFFSHATRSAKTSPINRNVALLLPLIALSSTTVLTAALSSDFDWLYPVRVFATIGTLRLLHRHLSGLFPYQFSFVPVIASVGVFLIWLALVADDAIVMRHLPWSYQGWLRLSQVFGSYFAPSDRWPQFQSPKNWHSVGILSND